MGYLYSPDTEQQQINHSTYLPIKHSLALKHFSLIKTVRLSYKSHDGAGFLSSIDGASKMIDEGVITLMRRKTMHSLSLSWYKLQRSGL